MKGGPCAVYCNILVWARRSSVVCRGGFSRNFLGVRNSLSGCNSLVFIVIAFGWMNERRGLLRLLGHSVQELFRPCLHSRLQFVLPVPRCSASKAL